MKKTKFALLTAMVTFTALTSCGGGRNTIVDQDLPEGDPTSETTIHFWHCLGQAKTKILQNVIDRFNEEHSGKYKVEATALSGGYDELHDTLTKKLADGKVPGISMGYPDSFSTYISKKMTNSSLLRVTNWINDSRYGYSQAEIQDFIPGYYAEGTGYQFEGTWSMPMYKSTEVMYYNLDMFNGFNSENDKKFQNDQTYQSLKTLADGVEVKVTDDEYINFVNYVKEHGGYQYEVPTTWQEMINLGRQMIANREAESVTTTGAFWPIGYDSDANLMISHLKMRGIPYTDACKTNPSAAKADHFLFKNPQAKALLTEFKGLIDDRVLITKGKLGGNKYTNSYFNDRQVAMTIGSTGGSSYNDSTNFHVEIAPVPCWENDQGEVQKYYIQQGPSICFFDNENPWIHKGSWLFYKFLASTEENCYLALENSYDPVRSSAYQLDMYTNWIAKKDVALQYKIPATTATMKEHYFTSDTFVGSATARSEMGSLIDYVCNQNLSIDVAFDLAFNACIDAA